MINFDLLLNVVWMNNTSYEEEGKQALYHRTDHVALIAESCSSHVFIADLPSGLMDVLCELLHFLVSSWAEILSSQPNMAISLEIREEKKP